VKCQIEFSVKYTPVDPLRNWCFAGYCTLISIQSMHICNPADSFQIFLCWTASTIVRDMAWEFWNMLPDSASWQFWRSAFWFMATTYVTFYCSLVLQCIMHLSWIYIQNVYKHNTDTLSSLSIIYSKIVSTTICFFVPLFPAVCLDTGYSKIDCTM